MASSHLKELLECSICLNIYRDPVTLKCGHNFCRDCIGHLLDTQEESGGYSCPVCRDKFWTRPSLQKNITLCKILEALQKKYYDQNKTGILCTYCIHPPVPAVKSCLLCEASLCGNHLKVHSKSSEHVLCDPTTSLESRKCSVHKKILEYYCPEDSAFICVSCRLDGEHRGHRVETLDEASEMKKKKLRDVLQKLMTEREETEKRVQSLQERRRRVQGKAAEETERVTALIRDLRRQLEDLEKRVLRDISGQAERVSLSLDDLIQQLEIKKDELYSKMYYIVELCNTTDPLTVLQESETSDLDRERHDRLLHDVADLNVSAFSCRLRTGLCDIMSGVNVQECPGTHVCQHSSTKGKFHIDAKISWAQHHPTPTAQPTLGVSGVTDILLDESTAGNLVSISDDRKTAFWSFLVNRPRSEGLPGNEVLSSQSFCSGRHYWEVDVGSYWWRVGMSYPRRGDESGIGYNKKSWCLERWMCNHYSVMHDNNKIPLPGKVSSNRVRVDLDYEAGWISFYDLCDPIRHLYTFTTTFTEPLHAAFSIGMSMIKISGGN